MKTSNKIFFITIISVLAITVILIAGAWIFISRYDSGSLQVSKGSSEIIRKDFNIMDFNSVSISGFHKVKIIQNNSYSINLSAPEYLIDYIKVVKSDNMLNISQLYYKDILPETINIRIAMPQLNGIKTRGNSKIGFSGFNTNNLVLELYGSNKITGRDSSINNLRIIGSGLLRTDLDSCSIVNANLDLSGSGATDLNMAGGKLSGTVNGIHKINYRGKVIEQNIITSGSVKVERKDSL